MQSTNVVKTIRSVVFDPSHVPGPRFKVFGICMKHARLRRWSCWEILGILTGVRVVKTRRLGTGGWGGGAMVGWLIDS